jgi:hypothetical protein
VARLLPLIRLSSRRLGEAFGMRAGRTYAIGISLSYALLLLLLPASTDARTAGLVLSEALRAASWAVAGFGALSAARDLSTRDHDDGLVSLANASGYRTRDVLVSHWAAGAMRIAFWLFVPFALLALFAGVRFSTPRALLWASGWLAVALVYAPLLGVTASTLSRGAARLFPGHGRIALLLFVVGPHLLRLSFPELPSVPAAFAWLLEQSNQLVQQLAWA